MLPLMSSFTAASSGPQGSLSNATADMIWPEVQYPQLVSIIPSGKLPAIGCSASGSPDFDGSNFLPIKQQGQSKTMKDTPAVPHALCMRRTARDHSLFSSVRGMFSRQAIQKGVLGSIWSGALFAVNAQRDRDGALDVRFVSGRTALTSFFRERALASMRL